MPLPFFRSLGVAWAIVGYISDLGLGEALSDGALSPSARRAIIRRALNPAAIEGLVEAIERAAGPRRAS